MVRPSPLDDPERAKNAWAHYRRLMRWMAGVSLGAVIAALLVLRWMLGEALTLHMIVATSAGIGLSVLLAAALMGLVFLSSGTGHDEAIEDPFGDDPEIGPDAGTDDRR